MKLKAKNKQNGVSRITLNDNQLSEAAVKNILNCVEIPCSLNHLDLERCQISEESVRNSRETRMKSNEGLTLVLL